MWWIIIVLYVALDLNYFIRTIFTLLAIALSTRNLKLTDTITCYGICTTQDVDFFLNHMNNARFLRELDFSRFQWYGRCRFWSKLRSIGGSMMQGATLIRYRKMLPLFKPFRVDTKLVWWDEISIFLEHTFVSLPDGFARSVAISRQVATGVDVIQLMQQFEECWDRPQQPEEIRYWLEAIAVSSLRLRNEC
ncbi:protein THEM6-like [Malaya genurostris]|uniref:protein THEM6-like n=1 Tax=Malaya genurostris TaxID=325434 RepID=UPI0026F3A252|nr:protein THEM6-like [Malaya genurostris]XP_058450719.1 protein THEM6-like [Malaya genurostris]